MNNKYTEIGEAVVTSTVTGKAKVRILLRRNFGSLIYWLVGGIVLAVLLTWLWGEKPTGTATEPAAREDNKPAAQVNIKVEKMVQAPVAETIKPEAGKPEPVAPAQLSPQQQAKNELHKAQQLAQQGNINEAIESYRAALLQDVGNEAARQAMVDLLLKAKRNADAERALQIGLKNNPKQSSYSLQLARLLAERNLLQMALDVMQRTQPYAAGQADYQAFYASLLQRQNRYSEAVIYYQKAIGLKPGSGEWLMGLGISLQGAGRTDEANAAFKHALETHNLSAQSRAFVEQQVNPPVANPQ